MKFEVYFYVEHNYSLDIPEDKIEQIKADMEADLKKYASGEYISDIIERDCYNKPKTEGNHVPQCPPCSGTAHPSRRCR